GLFAHRGQELEVLVAVRVAGTFGPQEEQAGQRVSPQEGDEQREVTRVPSDLLRARNLLGADDEWTPLAPEERQQRSFGIDGVERRGRPDGRRAAATAVGRAEIEGRAGGAHRLDDRLDHLGRGLLYGQQRAQARSEALPLLAVVVL